MDKITSPDRAGTLPRRASIVIYTDSRRPREKSNVAHAGRGPEILQYQLLGTNPMIPQQAGGEQNW
jgi:hypothetical protein